MVKHSILPVLLPDDRCCSALPIPSSRGGWKHNTHPFCTCCRHGQTPADRRVALLIWETRQHSFKSSKSARLSSLCAPCGRWRGSIMEGSASEACLGGRSTGLGRCHHMELPAQLLSSGRSGRPGFKPHDRRYTSGWLGLRSISDRPRSDDHDLMPGTSCQAYVPVAHLRPGRTPVPSIRRASTDY